MHLSLKISAASACLLATACTGQSVTTEGGGGDGQSSSGPQTIKWLIEEPEDAAALKDLKAHVGEFTQESGITVEVSTLDTSTMRTLLQTQLRSGEGPDVFNWGSGPGFGGALAEAGLVRDLSDAYEENDWQVFDFARERVSVDGKPYSVPGEVETIGIFYNKDIFAQEGIEEPTTMDDLVAAAQKLKAAGKIPMAASDKDGWQGGHYLSMALSSTIGSEGMEALINGEQSWDSPEVVSALEMWKSFDEQGFLPKSPTSVDYDTSLSMFYSGDAAMIPTGSWLVGEIDDNMKDVEVGYIPFPSTDGNGIFTGGLGSGPYVSATTKNEAAALKFVDFLASPEHGAWTVENLHTIPPMELDTTDLDVSPLFAQVLEDTADVTATGDFGYNIDVVSTDTFNESMWDGFQGVLTGQRSPEEVAADLQTAASK